MLHKNQIFSLSHYFYPRFRGTRIVLKKAYLIDDYIMEYFAVRRKILIPIKQQSYDLGFAISDELKDA
jgi:hypothetical protein